MTSTAVRQIPILFSSPMVRAVLEGRKVQTRRVIKPQPFLRERVRLMAAGWCWNIGKTPHMESFGDAAGFAKSLAELARWKIGDVLWVKERWCSKAHPDTSQIIWNEDGNTYQCLYEADGGEVNKNGTYASPWRSPRFMPKFAARLWLEVTDVRVERLNSISEADAIAEGLLEWTDPPRIPTKHYGAGIHDVWETDPRKAYARLWDSINGESHSWESNCWVWVVAFKKLEARPS